MKTIQTKYLLLIIGVIIVALANCKRKSTQNIYYSKTEGVHAAFYNSFGDRKAVSTTQGNLLLLDTQLNIIKKINTKQGNATSSFFSLNDSFIITGGIDKSLCIWDSKTLERRGRYVTDFYLYASIYGVQTFGGSGTEGRFIMYNHALKDTFSTTLEKEGAYHLYYCIPDSVVVVGSGHKGFQIDICNKKIVNEYLSHTGQVYCIMPSNSLEFVVSGAADSTVKIFNRNSGELLSSSDKLDGEVYVCCFNHNDSIVAASTSSGYIYLFDNQLKHIKKKVKAFETLVNGFHYSPDGSRMVAVSEGGGMKIYSTKTWQVLYELKSGDY